jgi:hypothetical protein
LVVDHSARHPDRGGHLVFHVAAAAGLKALAGIL